MNTANLEIVRGDDKYYIITVKDSGGLVIDITGWKVYFTVKKNKSDTDANAKIKKNVISHTDPTNGKTQIHLSHTDTILDVENYYYDMQVKKSDGTIVTVLSGVFSVVYDITTRID